MDNLPFTNALWPSEKSSGKKAAGIYEVNSPTAISAQLATLTQKVDHTNATQVVGPKCKHTQLVQEIVNVFLSFSFTRVMDSRYNLKATKYFIRQIINWLNFD